ncbi:MAG TPA: type VII secretion protein EccCa, partial [Ktedonobacterales bacterium]|nr:type VII secretion protein EccCa [Ktedonobacterales bacterium]
DFLGVRIGSGPAPLSMRPVINMEQNPSASYDEELLARARALVTRFEYVEGSPIVIPLQPLGVVSLRGAPPDMRALARSLVTQIAVNQAPEDVRICAYFPPETQHEWSWLRWLPHTRRLRQMRVEHGKPEQLSLLATTVEDFRKLLDLQLAPELDRRRKLINEKADLAGGGRLAPMRPHLVVLLDGFSPSSPLAQTPMIQELLQDGPALGATVICLTAEGGEEPATTQARISQLRPGWLVYEETAEGGRRYEAVAPDAADPAECERIARTLAPLIVAEKGAQQDLSQDVRLLDLLRIRSVDDIQIAQTWRPRAKADLLRVPIGLQDDGEALYIDVKEAAEGGMGPHGMVIGATGSGKSELLRTLVTSLAITHDPETLNFVLADFKGGASFADLAGLPHVSGMITNLEDDLSLVDRMRSSLDGEQARRQRMLREAGNLDNIRQYQAKWRVTPHMEPMPYLLIIVDEFAELLTQRPDFLDTFTAIGRVGRSLGVSMLLATQRLGEGRIQGLESYLRYRICLRTLTPAESMAVIGKNDAYFLSSFPGVGYFKVDALYQRFKSAIVSVPYTPPGQEQDAETLVRTFSPVGALTTWEPAASLNGAHANESAAPTGVEDTEMDVIIDRLVEQCAQGRVVSRQTGAGERVTAPMPVLDATGVVAVSGGLASSSGSSGGLVGNSGGLATAISGAMSGGLTHAAADTSTIDTTNGYARPHQVWLPPLRVSFPLGEVIATAQSMQTPPPTLFDGAR